MSGYNWPLNSPRLSAKNIPIIPQNISIIPQNVPRPNTIKIEPIYTEKIFIAASEALTYFFNTYPERFGTISDGTYLMDNLPLVQRGYLSQYSASTLLNIYVNKNNLEESPRSIYITSDDLMDAAFGGDIPSAFVYDTFDVRGHKIRKISTIEAIQKGIIQVAQNTYNVISIKYPNFNPKRFIGKSDLIYLNSYSAEDIIKSPILSEKLGDVLTSLQDEDFQNMMINEGNIITDFNFSNIGKDKITLTEKYPKPNLKNEPFILQRQQGKSNSSFNLQIQQNIELQRQKNLLQKWRNEVISTGQDPGNFIPSDEYLINRYGPVKIG